MITQELVPALAGGQRLFFGSKSVGKEMGVAVDNSSSCYNCNYYYY